MAVDFDIVREAFQLANMGGAGETQVYLHRQADDYVIVSQHLDAEEMPDGLDSEEYIALPSKNELDLGQRLVLRFARAYLEQDYDEVAFMFRRKGAYARFKALLERKSLLEPWYAYEREAEERALREWCEEIGLKLSD